MFRLISGVFISAIARAIPSVREGLRVSSLISCILFGAGCAMGQAGRVSTPLGLSEIRKVFVYLVGEPREMSENGREFSSQYFDSNGKSIGRADKAKKRIWTLFQVDGDRRPYEIYVKSYAEILSSKGDQYEDEDLDPDATKKMTIRLRKQLRLVEDTRNVIDDFRPY